MSRSSVSEARLTALLDMAASGIIVIDDKARVLEFNKAAERLFGLTAGDVIGRDLGTLIPAERAEGGVHDAPANLRRALGEGREVSVRHADGSLIPVEVAVAEAATPEGPQFIGILHDLRARNATEQRLQDLQADLLRMARVSAMDEMGAALAHELNQPLTALLLYLQAVERASAKQVNGHALPDIALGILQKAAREAERAGHIIQRIRSFVEKRQPVRRLVDINPIVTDAIDLTLLGSRPGTQVSRKLADELPQVTVDPVQIQQVVVNLVRNAIEAVKDQHAPDVRVTTRAAETGVLLVVEDNGPGIPRDLMPELFRAFSSSKGGGLGLGLAISKTIIQTHGGDLTVDPGGNGRGACFTLQLPLPQTMA